MRELRFAAANGGATKARMMYMAYLSYGQVTEYIDFLLSKNLLKYDGTTKLYSTTEQSLRFIHAYRAINEMGMGLEGLEAYTTTINNSNERTRQQKQTRVMVVAGPKANNSERDSRPRQPA